MSGSWKALTSLKSALAGALALAGLAASAPAQAGPLPPVAALPVAAQPEGVILARWGHGHGHWHGHPRHGWHGGWHRGWGWGGPRVHRAYDAGPRWHHRPYWGPRRPWGPRYGYYGRPGWGPRCAVRQVRTWDPYWGGYRWRTVRRCW